MDSVAKIDKEISALQQKRQAIIDSKKEKNNKTEKLKKVLNDLLIEQAMDDFRSTVEKKCTLVSGDGYEEYYSVNKHRHRFNSIPQILLSYMYAGAIAPSIQNGKAVYRPVDVLEALNDCDSIVTPERGTREYVNQYNGVNLALKKINKLLGYKWVRFNYGGIEIPNNL